MLPAMSSNAAVPLESVHPQAPGSSLLPVDAWLYLCGTLRLSSRELQIVQGVFDDLDQAEIARTVSLSPEAVYRAMQRIYIKLRIGSRAELIVRVMSEYLAYAADQPQSEM